ncbi:MAG: hypothetical protein GXO75_16215, partial [Calditrichaeota bacterium]|nr:hypothetical protein [Calditrichota bacterium]
MKRIIFFLLIFVFAVQAQFVRPRDLHQSTWNAIKDSSRVVVHDSLSYRWKNLIMDAWEYGFRTNNDSLTNLVNFQTAIDSAIARGVPLKIRSGTYKIYTGVSLTNTDSM